MATAPQEAAPVGARRSVRPPPLDLWRRALAIAGALVLMAVAVFIFVATPLPVDEDRKFYETQLANLDGQRRSLAASGQRPLSIVFIGTSRLKNVAFDATEVAQSARQAGVLRPVASTYIAVNWGSFERFKPAVEQIEKQQPDVVIIMPEFFFEDFNHTSRAWLGFRYLQTKLWGQPFKVFGAREFHRPVCHGFERTIEDRLADHSEWIMDSRQSPGPALARDTVRKLGESGTLVIVADVPVSKRMTKLRPGISERQFKADSGIGNEPYSRRIWMPSSFPDTDYCDWAHLDPMRAGGWRQIFFGKIAEELNQLPQ